MPLATTDKTCRTYNGFDINGLGFKKDGRGNLAPVTIILPTLAMEAKEKLENLAQVSNITTNEDNLIEEFMSILDTKIHEAKDMLLERYKLMCSQPASAARFMYENNTMAGYIP